VRGDGSGRTLFPVRVPAHRATTRNLQGLYPFVVDASLGSQGVYLGRQAGSDASFVYDPWQAYATGVVTNPNLLLAGVIGSGKSALAKSLALRLTAFGVRVWVPGDPKGEWAIIAHALGQEPITLGRGLPARVNPLDPGHRPAGLADGDWAREVRARRLTLLAALAATTLARPLTPVERSALVVALDHLTPTHPDPGVRAGGVAVPVLPEVVHALMNPTRDGAASLTMTPRELQAGSRDLALELRRLVAGDLAGLFDGPTTHTLDPSAPIQVLDTSRLAGDTGDDTAIALLMTCASAWMETALTTPTGAPPPEGPGRLEQTGGAGNGRPSTPPVAEHPWSASAAAAATAGRRLVVYDEAWRMLRHLPLVRRMQAQWKLSRALGVANLAVLHRISDLGAVGNADSEAVALAQGLLADCSTRIVYAQETDQVPATASALGLTDVEADQLIHLPRGRGLWKIGRHAAIVDHHLAPAEHGLVDTDAAMRIPSQPMFSNLRDHAAGKDRADATTASGGSDGPDGGGSGGTSDAGERG
jgi:hypothetical protein